MCHFRLIQILNFLYNLSLSAKRFLYSCIELLENKLAASTDRFIKEITEYVLLSIAEYNQNPFDDLIISSSGLRINAGFYGTTKFKIYVHVNNALYKGIPASRQDDTIGPEHSQQITKIINPIFKGIVPKKFKFLELSDVSFSNFYYYPDEH